jgi:hypothetical protein
MKKARGNTRIILEKVGEIQQLVGRVKGDMMNDRNAFAIDRAMEDIQTAFDLCLEITGMYDRIPAKGEKRS